MMRLYPSATLFPYTTLFRSGGWLWSTANPSFWSGTIVMNASGILYFEGGWQSTRLHSSHMSAASSIRLRVMDLHFVAPWTMTVSQWVSERDNSAVTADVPGV